MIGLTYVDNLKLTRCQWITVLLCPVIPYQYQWLCFPVILWVFWGKKIGRDHRILWSEVRQSRGKKWEDFLSTLHTRRYINLQNPYVTYLFGLLGFQAFQIIVLMGFVLTKIRLTPLTVLMMTQPSHDTASFILIILTRVFMMRSRMMSALLYGVACATKPTSLVILPVMVFDDVSTLISLALFIGYMFIIYQSDFGKHFVNFLFPDIGFYLCNDKTQQKTPFHRRIKERWSRYRLRDYLLGSLFFLFPYYSLTRESIFVFVAVSLFAPNIKYLILCSLP